VIDPSRIPGVLGLGSLVHLVRRGLRQRSGARVAAGRERDRFYRDVWEEAAQALGAELRPLADELLEIRRGQARVRVLRNYTSLDDPVALRVAGDKALVHRLLAEAGVPTPAHVVCPVRSLGPARAFLRQRGGRPCVVKPASGTGAGDGVSTGVRTPSQFGWAVAFAAQHGPRVVVEEQVEGENYRLLLLDGECLDVVRLCSPELVGDGRSSIRALLRRANRERLAGGYRAAQVQLALDREVRATLAEQGQSLRSVPPAGARVRVKTVVNQNAAVENEAIEAGAVSRALVEAAAQAAAAVGARFAGVDVITRDVSKSLEDAGGVVLEVNTCPGHYVHYHRRGRACPVAQHALAALLGSARAASEPLRPRVARGSRS
jgi:cyanophycin synthetase